MALPFFISRSSTLSLEIVCDIFIFEFRRDYGDMHWQEFIICHRRRKSKGKDSFIVCYLYFSLCA